ncbi:uncharacterized protein BDZ83DRAFT_23804 [Colletotrichum acutatum]|uniref:Uncharacterized protein n=1 Tax=Glomerella acutata TaxID=27357 RepID=A0AAD8UHS3_GLOAC|nr:uncharacterized protein BDZ83DRAFT_23804 [Colletotrichum acutatum]KAK1717493.1 hypothetical protein BDZ83DRAFT_23804 [Colletotrichum acutatum]
MSSGNADESQVPEGRDNSGRGTFRLSCHLKRTWASWWSTNAAMLVGDGVEWPLFWVNRPPEHPRHANALSRLSPASPAQLVLTIQHMLLIISQLSIRPPTSLHVHPHRPHRPRRRRLSSVSFWLPYSTRHSFNCHGNSSLAPHILTCRETAFAPFALGGRVRKKPDCASLKTLVPAASCMAAENIHALEWCYVMRPPHLDVLPCPSCWESDGCPCLDLMQPPPGPACCPGVLDKL